MKKEKLLGKNRLEALTDGIYAIAMTLGVLAIDVSEITAVPEGGELIDQLSSIFPKIVHYAITFFVLLSFWMAHNRQMNHLRKVDEVFTALSLVVLFFVAIVPFTTDLAGSYSEYSIATTIYAGNLMIIGLLSLASYFYATAGRRLVMDAVSKEQIQYYKAKCISIPLVSLLVILYANFISADYASALYLLIPLVKKMVTLFWRDQTR